MFHLQVMFREIRLSPVLHRYLQKRIDQGGSTWIKVYHWLTSQYKYKFSKCFFSALTPFRRLLVCPVKKTKSYCFLVMFTSLFTFIARFGLVLLVRCQIVCDYRKSSCSCELQISKELRLLFSNFLKAMSNESLLTLLILELL